MALQSIECLYIVGLHRMSNLAVPNSGHFNLAWAGFEAVSMCSLIFECWRFKHWL